jgi:chorismate mutase-like protein
MSTSTASETAVARAAGDAVPELAALRAEIDRLDDSIHDLLMQRASVVGQVAELGRRGKVPFRPGREAAIIRRLLARHTGKLPRRALYRLWREIYAAFIAIETPFAIAVCDADGGGGFTALAREHFGALTPMRTHRSPAQAIGEVSAGAVTAAVLPAPQEEEAAPWWVALLHRDAPSVHVVARLPFWAAPRPEGAPVGAAWVVAAAAPDASGADRSLLGFQIAVQTSRARLSAALAEAGLPARQMLLRRDPRGPDAVGLVELDGYMTQDDPRLRRLAAVVQRPVVLGGYALPVDGSADGSAGASADGSARARGGA